MKSRQVNTKRQLARIARLFYEEGLNKTEIAEELKVSITHVNRLLKAAHEKGIVKITIEVPRKQELELDLIKTFGLIDAKVIACNEDEQLLRTDLGIEAAKYFEKEVKDGNRIGIGSGRTMYEMVKALEEKPREISIFPISSIVERGLEIKSVSANTLVNTLWFKFRPACKAYRIDLFFPEIPIAQVREKIESLITQSSVQRIYKEITDLDFYFFSIGYLREDSQLVELAKECKMNINDLRKANIIGDYLFNTIDENGKFISCGLEGLTFKLSLEQFDQLASHDQKRVIAVAGGNKKLSVIRAGIKAHLFNILITDEGTAIQLLEEVDGTQSLLK